MMKLSDMPEETRVKLERDVEEEFWNSIEERGGIKKSADSLDVSASSLYNWRNKDVFLPLPRVLKISDNLDSDDIKAVKGEGRGKIIRNPSFRFKDRDELLTRVRESVNINRNGIPVYQTDERSLLERFNYLLQQFGDVPTSVYRRSLYELRYPKFLHKVLEKIDFEEDLGALVDESGSVEEDYVMVEDMRITVENFEEELFSKDKSYRLALARNDEEVLKDIIRAERRKIENL